MTDTPITYAVPEPIYVTLILVWAVAVALAYLAGYCAGRWAEAKRRGL